MLLHVTILRSSSGSIHCSLLKLYVKMLITLLYVSVTLQHIVYMIYICQLQLGCHPVAEVQYTFTHKQYVEQHNNFGIVRAVPRLGITLAFALQPRKKPGKTSVRVAASKNT